MGRKHEYKEKEKKQYEDDVCGGVDGWAEGPRTVRDRMQVGKRVGEALHMIARRSKSKSGSSTSVGKAE